MKKVKKQKTLQNDRTKKKKVQKPKKPKKASKKVPLTQQVINRDLSKQTENIKVELDDKHKDLNLQINIYNDKTQVNLKFKLIKELDGLIKKFKEKRDALMKQNIDLPNDIFDIPIINIEKDNDISEMIGVIKQKIKDIENFKPQNNIQLSNVSMYAGIGGVNVSKPTDKAYMSGAQWLMSSGTNVPFTQQPIINPYRPAPVGGNTGGGGIPPLAPNSGGGEYQPPNNPQVPPLQPSTGDGEYQPQILLFTEFLGLYNSRYKTFKNKQIDQANTASELDNLAIELQKVVNDVDFAINQGQWTRAEITRWEKRKNPSQTIDDSGYRNHFFKLFMSLNQKLAEMGGQQIRIPNSLEASALSPSSTSNPTTTSPCSIMYGSSQDELRRTGDDPNCEPAPVIPVLDSSSDYNDELCSQIKQSMNQLWSYMGRYKDQLTQSEHEYLKGEYDELVELYQSNCNQPDDVIPEDPTNTYPKCDIDKLGSRFQDIISQLEAVNQSKAQESGRSVEGINRLNSLLNANRAELNNAINLCAFNPQTAEDKTQHSLEMITALDIAPVPVAIALYSVQPDIPIRKDDTLTFVAYNPPAVNSGDKQRYKLMYNGHIVLELNNEGNPAYNVYFNEDGNIYDSEDLAPETPDPVNPNPITPVIPIQPRPPDNTNSPERVSELNEARRSLYYTSRPMTNRVANILAEQITEAINTPNGITILDKTNGNIPMAYALIYANVTNPNNVKSPHFRRETSFSSSMGIGYRLWNNNRELKGAGTDALIFNQWGELYDGRDQNGNYTPDKTFPFSR